MLDGKYVALFVQAWTHVSSGSGAVVHVGKLPMQPTVPVSLAPQVGLPLPPKQVGVAPGPVHDGVPLAQRTSLAVHAELMGGEAVVHRAIWL